MTKAELEKQIEELTKQTATLKEENKRLISRTATAETTADEVRNFYANYLNRCSVVREWTMGGHMSAEDIEGQKRIRERLYHKYEGSMTIYCVLFDDNKKHQECHGDRRWSNWTNYDIVSDEAMSKKTEWAEAVAKNKETQKAFHEWKTANKKEETKC
ncbi:MAG: hypothetical protein PHE09_19905 [Oscillospiraceae bacterium]|nr:hypothetical protein [Oscillospiraceae bacterium]